MKKLLFVFLTLCFTVFADWEVLSGVDEFGDATEEKNMVSHDNEYDGVVLSVSKIKTNFLKREKNGNIKKTQEMKTQYHISVELPDYIGNVDDDGFNETFVKIKNDKNEVIDNLKAYTIRDGYGIIFKPENNAKLIELIKKSETLKIAIVDFEDDTHVLTFNVTGFSESEKQITTILMKY